MSNTRRIRRRVDLDESRRRVLVMTALLGCECTPDVEYAGHPARGHVTAVHVRHDSWCPLVDRAAVDYVIGS